MNFNCSFEGIISMHKLTFLSHFLPIQLTHCYLDSSFQLILLPLEYLSKLYVVPTLLPTDFPIFLFYPVLTSPIWVIPSFMHALWEPKFQQPLFTISQSALPSLYYDLLVCWLGSSSRSDERQERSLKCFNLTARGYDWWQAWNPFQLELKLQKGLPYNYSEPELSSWGVQNRSPATLVW